MGPVEDMYALLLRYEVRVPKDETDIVSDMRYSWKKLRKLASDVSDNLARLQVCLPIFNRHLHDSPTRRTASSCHACNGLASGAKSNLLHDLAGIQMISSALSILKWHKHRCPSCWPACFWSCDVRTWQMPEKLPISA